MTSFARSGDDNIRKSRTRRSDDEESTETNYEEKKKKNKKIIFFSIKKEKNQHIHTEAVVTSTVPEGSLEGPLEANGEPVSEVSDSSLDRLLRKTKSFIRFFFLLSFQSVSIKLPCHWSCNNVNRMTNDMSTACLTDGVPTRRRHGRFHELLTSAVQLDPQTIAIVVVIVRIIIIVSIILHNIVVIDNNSSRISSSGGAFVQEFRRVVELFGRHMVSERYGACVWHMRLFAARRRGCLLRTTCVVERARFELCRLRVVLIAARRQFEFVGGDERVEYGLIAFERRVCFGAVVGFVEQCHDRRVARAPLETAVVHRCVFVGRRRRVEQRQRTNALAFVWRTRRRWHGTGSDVVGRVLVVERTQWRRRGVACRRRRCVTVDGAAEAAASSHRGRRSSGTRRARALHFAAVVVVAQRHRADAARSLGKRSGRALMPLDYARGWQRRGGGGVA